jgi:hypothetical protein
MQSFSDTDEKKMLLDVRSCRTSPSQVFNWEHIFFYWPFAS